MSEKMRKKTAATPQAMTGARALTARDVGVEKAEKVQVSPVSFATAIRVLMQNWRQGTVAVKGRSDVSFSNKKPWRQKGTGRARAGSARSPLWRGGGICHGPMPRTRTLSLNKQTRNNVCEALFWNYLQANKIVCLDASLSTDVPKTSVAYGALKNAGLVNKPVSVFVHSHDGVTQASFANMDKVRTVFFDQPNVFDLAKATSWVVLAKDLDVFKDMVNRWLSN